MNGTRIEVRTVENPVRRYQDLVAASCKVGGKDRAFTCTCATTAGLTSNETPTPDVARDILAVSPDWPGDGDYRHAEGTPMHIKASLMDLPSCAGFEGRLALDLHALLLRFDGQGTGGAGG